VPLHASWLRLVDHGDRTVLALTAAGSLPFGFYAATSFVVPVFPDMTGEIGFRLMIWSVAAGVAFSLMTLTAPTHRRRIGLAVLAAGSVSFGAAFLDHPLAEQGGLLLAVGASGSAAALFLLVPESGAIRGTGQQQKRAKIEKPVYWFVSVCAVAGLAWLPLSGSFWGGLMVVQAVFARNSTAAFFLVGAVLCLSVAMPALLRTQSDDSPSTSRTHVDRPRLVALLPLIVILTWIALAPHAVTGVTN